MTKLDELFKLLPEKKLDYILSKFKNDKMLILNNPCNPTGILYSLNEIKNLSKILKNITVL